MAKRTSVVDVAQLEFAVREDLNRRSPRAMAVMNPVRLVIENYPEGTSEDLEAINNPEDEAMGTRKVPFSKVLFMERDDFLEDPPKKFFRMAPGREVRLRYAYLVTCTRVVKDESGEITEIHCTYDPETRGGNAPDGRRVKSTIHWVSAEHAVRAEVRLYDRLFTREAPDEARGDDFTSFLNPESLQIAPACMIEPMLANAGSGERFQFERIGYFVVDADSTPERPVFNRTVTLRDTWARIEKAMNKPDQG
jgi:glutaminyl-tRNA synthetase